jgi:bifunctional DNase/RNase
MNAAGGNGDGNGNGAGGANGQGNGNGHGNGNGGNGNARPRRRTMLDMKVTQLRVDPLTSIPIVILKDVATQTEAVPIWIGVSEASAIATELEKVALERPMTHDLMKNIIGEVGVRVDRVEVHDFRDDIFYATIFLVGPEGREIRVDSRPSDALALALRTGARICVARKVIEDAKRIDKRPDDGDNDSPGILEQLSDEDFGKWKM